VFQCYIYKTIQYGADELRYRLHQHTGCCVVLFQRQIGWQLTEWLEVRDETISCNGDIWR